MPVNNFNQSEYELGNNDEMSLKEMFSMFPPLIKLAEKNNVYLIGFALHDNPLNLKNKFTTKGLADGRFWLIKKSNYKFDENVQLVDDVSWTAENIVRHGKVLVLNWCVPFFSRYTAGGFGSIEKRLDQRKKECAYLVKKFYPLVRFAKKAKWEAGTHIKLHVSEHNIKEARKNMAL